MSMNDDISLDASRVKVRGPGRAAAGGIGGLGLIGAIVYFIVTGNFPGLSTSDSDSTAGQSSLLRKCKTGRDANASTDCWMVATAESLDAYWGAALPQQTGVAYRKPEFVLFSGSTSTACGTANAQTGPFYCPADKSVYLDISFFGQLESKFGAKNSTLAQSYVVAHEFGHSIQDQLGILSRIRRSDTGPRGSLVRSELQADCLAGVWLRNASTTTDPSGKPFLVPPTQAELATAVDAASAVGDDHIMESSGLDANQESFTHGSSAKRVEWLMRGYQNGTFSSCDTWSTSVQ